MIKKISKLKHFGIFQNFSWGALDDFKDKNLIYGWNYSGKTTLSKLFQLLEFKDKTKYYNGSEFELSVDDNGNSHKYTQDTLVSFPYQVKVFNTEYIKRVFTWDEPKSDFPAISFYLGDPAGNLKTQISELDKKNERLVNIRDNRYQSYIKTFEEYNKANGKFSEKAKEIRDNYLPGLFDQNNHNKSHVKNIADKIKNNLPNFVLTPSDRDRVKGEATAVKKYAPQPVSLRFTENLEEFVEEVKHILEDTALKAVSFPELDEDEPLFNWVQTGIKLHEDAADCKFCTKTLPENRISDLNTYYSIKLQEIQQAIKDIQIKITAEKDLLKTKFTNKKDLAETFQKEFQKGINSFNETTKKYKSQLSILEKDLKRKGTEIFNSIDSSSVELISFCDDFEIIEKAIKEHNKWLTDFDDRKQKAIEKILNHYIAEYLTAENYIQKESSKNSALITIEIINSSISTNESKIEQFQAQLSDKVKGQSELNKSLEILLHRDDIKIEIRDDKFTLERSGHPATDLSEGEKSAIAFSYFLTELKALRDDDPPKLPNTIVCFDDPVSSLDSNHIFQVRSLLQRFFEVEDFKQLFVSTHNFEFFSLMYDSGIFSKTKKEVNRPLYFIKRDANQKASIEKLPKVFSEYKSEYVGIFHILKDYNESQDKANFPYALLIPNALRRFLELYTAMKYPTSFESIDKRMTEVFTIDDKPSHNVKLLHWFSHAHQFEKVQQHDDKILQIEDAVKDLMEHIEKEDELHWKGLNGLYPPLE